MAGGANSAKHAVTDEPTGPSGDAASLPDIVPGLDRDADGDASRGDPAPQLARRERTRLLQM